MKTEFTLLEIDFIRGKIEAGERVVVHMTAASAVYLPISIENDCMIGRVNRGGIGIVPARSVLGMEEYDSGEK